MKLTVNGHQYDLQVSSVEYGSVISTVTYTLCRGELTVRVESVTESLKYDTFHYVIVTVKDPNDPKRVWISRAYEGLEQAAFEKAFEKAEHEIGQPFDLYPKATTPEYHEFCEYLDDVDLDDFIVI